MRAPRATPLSPGVNRSRLPLLLAAAAYGVSATVPLDLDPDLDWEVGLATIVEDILGERSFFALVHPPGEPDFHDRDCFVVQLPPPDRR